MFSISGCQHISVERLQLQVMIVNVISVHSHHTKNCFTVHYRINNRKCLAQARLSVFNVKKVDGSVHLWFGWSEHFVREASLQKR